MKIRPPKKKAKTGTGKLLKDIEAVYLFNFEIVFNDDFQPHDFEITDEIADAVNTYRVYCNEKPAKAVEDLPALIAKMPQVPQLRNHLFVALRRMGRHDEAYAVNDQAIKYHPDYIYATLNKAVQLWENNELDAVEKLLGGNPITINRVFPKRKQFHAAEVFAFYAFLIRFWVTKGNQVAAESHLKFLKELAPGHPQLPELQKLVEIQSLKGMMSDLVAFSNRSKKK